jgi:hypothetical protein
MSRFVIASFVTGVVFAVLDGLIHANPLAQRLYAVYKPLARTSVNAPAGIAIDLAYGFLMAAVFLLLYPSLPGASGLAKGLSFSILVWLFRVVMGVAGEWMMFTVPAPTLFYKLATGFAEMAALGVLLGVLLRR